MSEENIDRLFDAAGRKIAAGEGLHRSYWKRYHDYEKPNLAKLELFAVARHTSSIEALEKLASGRFNALWAKHKASIQQLLAAEKARFSSLLQASGTPVQQDWELPDEIVEKKSGEAWEKHLFCNADGAFFAKLNNWEGPLLDEAMKEDGFVCWLRNLDRRDWAFCIPYELAGSRPFYPDFVVVRKQGSNHVVDILEPHDPTRSDAWAKAKGLAEFADKHGLEFGRLIFARKQGDIFQKVDMNDKNTRKKARAMQSQSDLESLFGS